MEEDAQMSENELKDTRFLGDSVSDGGTSA